MGIFKRVNVIRPNYGLFVLVAILLAGYAGNLSSEYMEFPAVVLAKPALIGVLLAAAVIIAVLIGIFSTRF